jgi:ribosomal protein S18 acetylase RimI-like enzyme
VTPAPVDILLAAPEDAEAILALQFLAFAEEAHPHFEAPIPPLTETVEEVRADITGAVVLKACLEGRIVGSVRGRVTLEGGCFVSRLMVHPGLRRQGVGTGLMTALQSHFPGATYMELLVESLSERNAAIYRGLGYEEVDRHSPVPWVTLIRMRKPLAAAGRYRPQVASP